MRRSPLMVTAGVLVLTVSAVIAVKFVRTYVTPAAAGSPPAAAANGPDADSTDGPADGGVDPAQQARFQAAAALAQQAKGHLAVMVHDRRSATDWQAGDITYATWAVSTVKLAIAANLLERSRSGEIKLDTASRQAIADMLERSSDLATNLLWTKFGKDAFVPWFQQQYGMTGLQFANRVPHNWDKLRCTPPDLIHLMSFILDQANPVDRDYLVAEMRRVTDLQHWGVWAAGAAGNPGVKNGWALETDGGVKHWVTHSMGFVGPDQQYEVAIMYDQGPGGTIDAGVHMVSNIVATAFGAKTPADVTVPPAISGQK